jgi:signal transduction histidine kinase
MNSGILADRPLRRLLARMGLFLAAVSLIAVLFNIYTINSIHTEQLKLTEELVGKLAAAYPQNATDIAETVLHRADAHAVEAGSALLGKYGYDAGMGILQDKRFLDGYAKYILAFVAFIAVILLANAYFTFKVIKDMSGGLESLSKSLDALMDGNYERFAECEEDTEGILGRLHVQLQQLALRMKLGMEKSRKERESIKSLVTDISHQIKTPLSSVKLFVTLLSEGGITQAETSEFLERSMGEVRKLEWLAGSLIKISKLETGMNELAQENCSFTATVKGAIGGILARAEEKNIAVDFHSEEDLWAFHDPKWTGEAIFNVLENGVKYTGRGGCIRLSLAELQSFVRLDVEDNGIGIPATEYNEIFKRFYRGKNDCVKNTEGSGVGLYLTRKILEEQGGSIIVESLPGCGTRFSLFLQKCQVS